MTDLPVTQTPRQATAAEVYFYRRVVDALLREDLRECVSRAQVREDAPLPASLAGLHPPGQCWLHCAHLGLWMPVLPARYMQRWRAGDGPLLAEGPAGLMALHSLDEVVACFSKGLDTDAARPFHDFGQECALALAHWEACEGEQRRWFASLPVPDNAAAEWPERLLHHDRLAAFLDHPFYPTARAKLGFAVADLSRYSPEFAPRFQLNWLAVPQARYHPSCNRELPGWPAFSDVGLPPALADTHALLPVHPFVWANQLTGMLAATGFAHDTVRAPLPWMTVTPTLSVRTLVLCDAPEWHIKLPLTIRTLGARNIRTIKPSTIGDGHRIQSLLAAVVAQEPDLAGRVLLTDEEVGAHVDHQTFLGFIARRYPAQDLLDGTPVPIAGLLADDPAGGSVLEKLVERHYQGDLSRFFDEYLTLTLRLHLTLWLRYGIALESNQQNSVLVFSGRGLRLLLKDNDAARIHRDALGGRWPELATRIADLQDERIAADTELPLAQMFITITLQLNLAAPVTAMAERLGQPATPWYRRIAQAIDSVLCSLAAAGEDTGMARRMLLEDETLPIKYLLSAATLLDKRETGARDVNKFYGQTSPNFLKAAR